MSVRTEQPYYYIVTGIDKDGEAWSSLHGDKASRDAMVTYLETRDPEDTNWFTLVTWTMVAVDRRTEYNKEQHPYHI